MHEKMFDTYEHTHTNSFISVIEYCDILLAFLASFLFCSMYKSPLAYSVFRYQQLHHSNVIHYCPLVRLIGITRNKQQHDQLIAKRMDIALEYIRIAITPGGK